MLINKSYIFSRIELLVKEKQDSLLSTKTEDDKLYKIKLRFPNWFRNIIFHPLNPAYSVLVQYKASKRKKKNQINIRLLHPFAIDFMQYCYTHDVEFDTDLYYPKEDEPRIISFIDNRLKSLIAGFNQIELSQSQMNMYIKRQELLNKTKKIPEGYHLTLDGNNYYLPDNTFEEHTYIHEYGLVHLPEYVKDYIKGKDFLDVGAYLGDTSILLLRKYNPTHIYAYEPVEENADNVRNTIRLNNTDKISVIQKGLGEKEAMLDIYIDPDKLSASSINNSISDPNAQKKQIHITTIDNECKDRKIGLIKMDIEGAEYSAIKGGLETIIRDKPVLLISAYHTGKDFFEIPPMLKAAVSSYQFRLIDLEEISPITEKIIVAYPSLDK
ncbi:FkbM family methyltransferase [Dysgonomonas macrotermitis]|uniref:Methyltransferase, FkbM family n=1 Tax=Dysgonomonas macrotermitis TaxID=1346286 RepID=A0A1M5E3K9_9BACT|nr:FkbM family methyltransferase [Dysgonomonas macrotermitis]SHF73734.1 methyltransferase, FkbM family [Dysgonomonas macrotermitis]